MVYMGSKDRNSKRNAPKERYNNLMLEKEIEEYLKKYIDIYNFLCYSTYIKRGGRLCIKN